MIKRLTPNELREPDGYLEFDAQALATLPEKVRTALEWYSTRIEHFGKPDPNRTETRSVVRYHMAGYRIREISEMMTTPQELLQTSRSTKE